MESGHELCILSLVTPRSVAADVKITRATRGMACKINYVFILHFLTYYLSGKCESLVVFAGKITIGKGMEP